MLMLLGSSYQLGAAKLAQTAGAKMNSCFKRSRLLAKLPVVLLVVLYAPAVSFAQMNGEAARDWSVVFRDTLPQGVLQFWIDHALDKEYGGLLGRLDRQGQPTAPGHKSVVLISRSL